MIRTDALDLLKNEMKPTFAHEPRPPNERVSQLASKLLEFGRLALGLTSGEGITETALPGFYILRRDRSSPRLPRVHESSLILVAQGTKSAILRGAAYTYEAGQQLVATAPIPVESQVLNASPERPFLSVSARLDPAELRDVLSSLQGASDHVALGSRSQEPIEVAPLDDTILRATIELLKTLYDPDDARVIAPLRYRELIYRALRGRLGRALKSLALGDSRQAKIGSIMRRIHADVSKRYSVPELARAAGMSQTVFYTAFKSVTAMTPNQYMRQLRVFRGRDLMLFEQMRVSDAAFAVGYPDAAQFSRDFGQVLGESPRAHVDRLSVAMRRPHKNELR